MREIKSCRLFAATSVLALFIFLPLLQPVAGQEDEAQASKKVYVRTEHEGTIAGSILFSGKAPKRRQFDMSQDEECVKSNPKALSEDLIVTNGRLANVFVYIKSGEALKSYAFEPPSLPVVLEQKRCRFVPHVLGVQVGQKLEVLNSDPTTHNVNAQTKSNEKWNMSQTMGAPPIVRTFARAETLIPIKCNQHPWMKAYVNVLPHPFFAVSNKDGSYRIEGLPPGEYTLVAWHEGLGEQSVQVTIVPYESRALDFTFNGPNED